MRRHSWKDTGQRADDTVIPIRKGATIEKCAHCGGERVPDRDLTTCYLYRNALGREARTSPDRWLGSSRVPPCVER